MAIKDLLTLPGIDFAGMAQMAEQYLSAIQALAADVKAMRQELQRAQSEIEILRHQLQRIEAWIAPKQAA